MVTAKQASGRDGGIGSTDKPVWRTYLPALTPNNARSVLELPDMLELRGPMSGLSIAPRSCRGVRSAPLFSRRFRI
eukprot:203881-Alexandrium_andersonii.AAC.1